MGTSSPGTGAGVPASADGGLAGASLELLAGPNTDSRKPAIRSCNGRISGASESAGAPATPGAADCGAVRLLVATGAANGNVRSPVGEGASLGAPAVSGGGAIELVIGVRWVTVMSAAERGVGVREIRVRELLPLVSSSALSASVLGCCLALRAPYRVCSCSVGEPINFLPKLLSFSTSDLELPDGSAGS